MNSFKKIKCWFFINPHERQRVFEPLEQEAARLFTEFIKDKYYGKGIGQFWFDLYVLDKVNFGQHNDGISEKLARLSANINKSIFDKSSDEEKIKLLLNAALVAIRFLSQRVPLPKDYQANGLVTDYEEYLTKLSLLMKQDQLDKAIIKHFDTTRFYFRRTETAEVDKNKVYIDLNEIQDYINNSIAGKTFGESINTIDFGYELYDFNGGFASFLKKTENYKRYGSKYKNYLVVKHFDYSQFKTLDKSQQYALLKSKILEGLTDYDSLNKKPKDFNNKDFISTMEKILTDYETMHVG